MNLGVLLSAGDSLEIQEKSGQFGRFAKFYLEKYSKNFDDVFVFSYGKDANFSNYRSFKLIPNRFNLHRFIYTFLMPISEKENFKKISVFRVMQITGAIPAILAKVFYQIPFIVTYGYKYHEFAKLEGRPFVAWLLKVLEFAVLKKADRIIVTTEELKKYVTQFAPPEKIHLIPNGVETKLFKPSKKKFNKKNIRIISVGRLEVQKNYFSLIEAVGSSKYRNFITLTLMGDGSQKLQIEKLARKFKVKLKIINFVPHQLLPDFFAKSDIFILPSIIEGHPKVLLEAMAAGLPSVASNISGNVAIVKNGQTGLLCTTEPRDIRKKLDFLIENSELRWQIAENARRFILENHSIEKLVSNEIGELIKFAKDA